MSGIHHLAIRVRDCAASARFYCGATSLREIRRFESEGQARAIWLGAGGTVVMLECALRGTGPDAGSGHVLVFPVDDLVEAEARLHAAGIPVTDRTASTLYLEDPDGHRVGLSVYRFDSATSA